jgi:hypothetical protein
MGNNPMPKPVVKNKDGLEKTFFNLIFILFHQLVKIRLISNYQTSAYIVLMIYGICSHDHTF